MQECNDCDKPPTAELGAVLAKEKMMRNETYQGLLSLHSWGEADDILFLSSLSEPVAEELGWMSGKQVTVRYWVTDKPCTRDEAAEAAMRIVMGEADVVLDSRYSEMTGYLWTDEDLNVGVLRAPLGL